MKKKGTFNQGWWNCFESFASELLSANRCASALCTSILNGAGITRREARSWLDRYQGQNVRVFEVVYEYWLKSK